MLYSVLSLGDHRAWCRALEARDVWLGATSALWDFLSAR